MGRKVIFRLVALAALLAMLLLGAGLWRFGAGGAGFDRRWFR